MKCWSLARKPVAQPNITANAQTDIMHSAKLSLSQWDAWSVGAAHLTGAWAADVTSAAASVVTTEGRKKEELGRRRQDTGQQSRAITSQVYCETFE